jgi:hypothetical protein
MVSQLWDSTGPHHCSLCITFPYLLINSIFTHVSYYEFFLVEYKEFLILLITDYTSTINTGALS